MAGYDDNLTAGSGTGLVSTPEPLASGYTGFLVTALDWFRGTSSRALRAEAAGNLRLYPDHLERALPGGTLLVDGRTTLGRQLRVGASVQGRYEPLLALGLVGLDQALVPPETGVVVPTTGFFERESLMATGSVFLERQWTRTGRTRVGYAYADRRFQARDYQDSRTQRATADHRHQLSRAMSVRIGYEHLDAQMLDVNGLSRPRRQHNVEAGSDVDKPVTRRTRLRASIGAGATHLASLDRERVPYGQWVPTGNGRIAIEHARPWKTEAGYRRGFVTLDGLTDRVFATDAAYVSSGGRVFGNVDLELRGTASEGRTSIRSGATDRYRTYGGSLQARLLVTPTFALDATYSYYRHRYSNPSALPEGFPGRYERHAVMLGASVRLPVLGRSRAGTAPVR